MYFCLYPCSIPSFSVGPANYHNFLSDTGPDHPAHKVSFPADLHIWSPVPLWGQLVPYNQTAHPTLKVQWHPVHLQNTAVWRSFLLSRKRLPIFHPPIQSFPNCPARSQYSIRGWPHPKRYSTPQVWKKPSPAAQFGNRPYSR